jgi:voltage-gated potassium channel
VLTFILSLYGLAIFGYVTAAIASLFIAHDAEVDKQEDPLAGRDTGDAADVQSELRALRQELAELRHLLRNERNRSGRQEVDGV